MKAPARLVRFIRISAVAIIAAVALHACCTVQLPSGNAKFALVFAPSIKVGVSQLDFMCALRNHHALPISLTNIFFNGIKIPVPFDCPREKAMGWQSSGRSKDGSPAHQGNAIHVGQTVYFQTVTDLEAFLNDIKVQPPDR